MLIVQLSEELRVTPHVVNSVSPGYVKRDLAGGNAFLTPEQGAKTPVKFALLGDDAVSGRYVGADGEIDMVMGPARLQLQRAMETKWITSSKRTPAPCLGRAADG
jgi:hypothetical protein